MRNPCSCPDCPKSEMCATRHERHVGNKRSGINVEWTSLHSEENLRHSSLSQNKSQFLDADCLCYKLANYVLNPSLSAASGGALRHLVIIHLLVPSFHLTAVYIQCWIQSLQAPELRALKVPLYLEDPSSSDAWHKLLDQQLAINID